jgi:hypothetical protein
MSPTLSLYDQPVHTVFDLLGRKENDLTKALGWGLAHSPHLAEAVLADLANELGLDDLGHDPAVSLQEHIPKTGFTDLDLRTTRLHIILEAKRGWALPSVAQISKYTATFERGLASAILVVAEGSHAFVTGKLPSHVHGPAGDIPVLYRSWGDLALLARGEAVGPSAESRLVRELVRYLKGLVNMQNPRDNMVYVVPLAKDPTVWSPISPRDIVLRYNSFFHPVGERYPHEPVNYLGFRFDDRLQQIRHADAVRVTERPRDFIPAFTEEYDLTRPHYLYTLGPPIVPGHEVRGGTVKRAAHARAAIDLLLTCDTIGEAAVRTKQRLDEAPG